jgi:outer membrane murein-binding lipoprotein Lpp
MKHDNDTHFPALPAGFSSFADPSPWSEWAPQASADLETLRARVAVLERDNQVMRWTLSAYEAIVANALEELARLRRAALVKATIPGPRDDM